MARSGSKRRSIPLAAQLDAALRQIAKWFGCTVADLQLNHAPSLSNRPWNEDGTDTIPAANDSAFLEWIPAEAHKVLTFGRGGERRITTRESDIAEPRRLDGIRAEHEAFRKRALAVEKVPKVEKSKWPKRPFAKKGKAR